MVMKKKLLLFLLLTMTVALCACKRPCEVHAFGEWEILKEATCIEDGERTRSCLNCDDAVEIETLPAVGHKYGRWENTQKATCIEEGVQIRKCKICANEESKSLGLGNHSFGEWEITLEPTCVQRGARRKICTLCGLEETSWIRESDHDYVDMVCTACQKEQYRFCERYEFYDTVDGLSVKVKDITVTEREGYNQVRLNWTVENVTENSEITHGQFKLHLADGSVEMMYGMFPSLFYKEKFDFFYDWKLLKDKEVIFVEYVPWGQNGKTPVEDAPHWRMP